jgi:hypothetical protein
MSPPQIQRHLRAHDAREKPAAAERFMSFGRTRAPAAAGRREIGGGEEVVAAVELRPTRGATRGQFS